MSEEIFKYKTPAQEFIYSDILLTDLIKKWGLNSKETKQQSEEEDWINRKEKFRDLLREEEDLENIEPKKLMNLRHRKIYALILAKAKKILTDEDFDSIEKAAEVADKAIKGERLIEGEVTERTEETLGVNKETLREIGRKIIEEKLKNKDG